MPPQISLLSLLACSVMFRCSRFHCPAGMDSTIRWWEIRANIWYPPQHRSSSCGGFGHLAFFSQSSAQCPRICCAVSSMRCNLSYDAYVCFCQGTSLFFVSLGDAIILYNASQTAFCTGSEWRSKKIQRTSIAQGWRWIGASGTG